MKRTLKMALIASLAVGGSYVLYGSQNKEEFVKCGGLDFRYEGLYVST